MNFLMPDKKLTDAEIRVALERMSEEDPNGFSSDILDLINRLQAENERLQDCIDEQDIEISRLYKRIDEIKAEAYKECIEKIKEKVNYKLENEWIFTAEGRTILYMLDNFLNNLVKEMVGEDK